MASLFGDNELLGEPTLEEMLADPIVQLIMERDGVRAQDMRVELDRVQQQYSDLITVQ